MRDYFTGQSVCKLANLQGNDISCMLADLEHAHLQAVNVQGRVIWTRGQQEAVPVLHPMDFPVQIIAVNNQRGTRSLPAELQVECTGLGGGDLNHPIPWDVCIRSDQPGLTLSDCFFFAMASSFFSFSGMVWRLPILGMNHHKNKICPSSGNFSRTLQADIARTYQYQVTSLLGCMEVPHLMSFYGQWNSFMYIFGPMPSF